MNEGRGKADYKRERESKGKANLSHRPIKGHLELYVMQTEYHAVLWDSLLM